MFIAALVTIAEMWKQPRCPTTEEWIKKMWYIFSMEFYSAIRNNDMWFEGKWMQLEDIMLSEVSQVQKDKGHMFSLIHGKWIQKINIYTHTKKNPNMIKYKLICRTCL
jgi:hypothetical protein